MKTSIPRLRRVRFKDGRSIEVLRNAYSEGVRKNLSATVSRALESSVADHADGFALVFWAASGEAYVDYQNEGRHLTAGQVPQYVKDILLAEHAIRWSKE